METRAPAVLAGLRRRAVSPHLGLRRILTIHFEMKYAGLKRENKISKSFCSYSDSPIWDGKSAKATTSLMSSQRSHYLGKFPRTFEGHLSKTGPLAGVGVAFRARSGFPSLPPSSCGAHSPTSTHSLSNLLLCGVQAWNSGQVWHLPVKGGNRPLAGPAFPTPRLCGDLPRCLPPAPSRMEHLLI